MKVLLFATIKMTIGIGFHAERAVNVVLFATIKMTIGIGFHAERTVNVETCVRRDVRRDGQRRTESVGGR